MVSELLPACEHYTLKSADGPADPANLTKLHTSIASSTQVSLVPSVPLLTLLPLLFSIRRKNDYPHQGLPYFYPQLSRHPRDARIFRSPHAQRNGFSRNEHCEAAKQGGIFARRCSRDSIAE